MPYYKGQYGTPLNQPFRSDDSDYQAVASSSIFDWFKANWMYVLIAVLLLIFGAWWIMKSQSTSSSKFSFY